MAYFNSTLENDDPKYPVTGLQRLCKAIVHQCLDDLASYDRYSRKDEQERAQCHETAGMKRHSVMTALAMIFPKSPDRREWAETVFTLAEYDQKRCQDYVLRQWEWVEREL